MQREIPNPVASEDAFKLEDGGEEGSGVEAPNPQQMERGHKSSYESSKDLEGLWCGCGALCCRGWLQCPCAVPVCCPPFPLPVFMCVYLRAVKSDERPIENAPTALRPTLCMLNGFFFPCAFLDIFCCCLPSGPRCCPNVVLEPTSVAPREFKDLGGGNAETPFVKRPFCTRGPAYGAEGKPTEFFIVNPRVERLEKAHGLQHTGTLENRVATLEVVMMFGQEGKGAIRKRLDALEAGAMVPYQGPEDHEEDCRCILGACLNPREYHFRGTRLAYTKGWSGPDDGWGDAQEGCCDPGMGQRSAICRIAPALPC